MYIPNLNIRFLDDPDEEGIVSASVFGLELGVQLGEATGLEVSASTIGVKLLAKSVGPGLCLVQVKNFSALAPSFSSSASFEDKLYNI